MPVAVGILSVIRSGPDASVEAGPPIKHLITTRRQSASQCANRGGEGPSRQAHVASKASIPAVPDQSQLIEAAGSASDR